MISRRQIRFLRGGCLALIAVGQLYGSVLVDEQWAFRPVTRPGVPRVDVKKPTMANPIDAFIIAQLTDRRLVPSPPADPRTLLRRVYFGLVGLPPSPAAQAAFESDHRPDAYERVVEDLLASGHYGERWARHWLDVVRFGESQGFEYDRIREHAWRYRDYVVHALNSDLPYHEFIRDQIAGDVLPSATRETIVAAGFLVAGPWDQAGSGSASPSVRAAAREGELDDMVGTVTQTFLGLTVNCARCHAHKFDPIPQEDYYRVKAVFQGVRHGERSVLTREEQSAFDQAKTNAQLRLTLVESALKGFNIGPQVAAAVAPSSSRRPTADRSAVNTSLNAGDAPAGLTGDPAIPSEHDQLVMELGRLKQWLLREGKPPMGYVPRAEEPGPTHVLHRGDPDKPQALVVAAGLSAIGRPPPDLGLDQDSPEAERRRQFAVWITDPENPLTARVIVNRVWHYHFGRGLVGTPNDFGKMGERPTHPELLDWLASWFVSPDGGNWSLKRLQRLIVTSATYRQASRGNPLQSQAVKVDADNRLLWRFAPHRLEAEAVRDALLAVSGELNTCMAGPGFRPFLHKGNGNQNEYFAEDPVGPEFDRRTVYRICVHSARDPLLDSLDCPEFSTRTPVRPVTTTPLQALSLMNDSFVGRQARHFAERIRREAGLEPAAEARQAWLWALAREPDVLELDEAERLIRSQGLEFVAWALFNANDFVYVR